MIILVDTNILLDVTQKREGHYEAAAAVWALVDSRTVVGYVSAISFNNLFYIARKKDGNRKAFEALRYVRQIFDIVPLDEKIIDQAIAATGSDFEDAIQIASAMRIRSDYIISRNQNDFSSSEIPAISAVEFLAIIDS